MPIDQMIEKFDAVMKWANRIGAYTNKTTGLHMNVSIPNYDRDKIDFIKLALFLGDEYVANQFNRLGTFYAKNTTERIRARKDTSPGAVEELFRQMRSGMNTMASRMVMAPSTDKYMSIHAKEGWIEFRSPGGDYIGEYAANRDKIVNTLLRMVVAMDIAMDPEAEKEEYARKLNRLFKPTKFTGGRGERQQIYEPLTGREEDTIKFFSQYSAGLLPKQALKSFIKQVQTQREVKKQKPDDGKQYWWRVSRPGYSGSIEVVAATREEAIEQATASDGYPSWRGQPDVRAEPIRPYEETPQQTSSRDQEFTGDWEVVSRNTDEVVYTFGGVGNAIADAERVADRWARGTGFDDPIYVRPVMRSRQQQQQTRADGQQSTDANYEIVDYRTAEGHTVFRFIANTPQEAMRKLSDWVQGTGEYEAGDNSWRNRYAIRPIAGRPTSDPVPGSTEYLNRELAAQDPAGSAGQQTYRVTYAIMDDQGTSMHDTSVQARNADAAMAQVRQALQARGQTPEYISADPLISTPAQGTESLPPGNTRWLVLDQNDREVYSFVHRSNQREANAYALQWLRQNGMLGRGEFMVVPTT
jgi:hypothetical protein